MVSMKCTELTGFKRLSLSAPERGSQFSQQDAQRSIITACKELPEGHLNNRTSTKSMLECKSTQTFTNIGRNVDRQLYLMPVSTCYGIVDGSWPVDIGCYFAIRVSKQNAQWFRSNKRTSAKLISDTILPGQTSKQAETDVRVCTKRGALKTRAITSDLRPIATYNLFATPCDNEAGYSVV